MFEWTSHIDREIDKDGVVFMSGSGRSRAIQHFCEDLSNLIQFKCDWSFTGGRFYMKVLPEGIDAVKAALSNKEWLDRYLVECSQESMADETYFEPFILPVALSVPEKPKTPPVVDEYIVTYDANGTKIRTKIGSRLLET